MRPTFLAFQTAHRAIATSQILLDTAGNNLANVQTPGYTRQRVDINSVSNGGAIQRYKPQTVTAGGGVEAKRVTRIRDQFLDARYRMQNSEDAKYAAIIAGLGDLENVMDQVSNEGILAEIANFKKALDPMLENPPSNDMAMVVRNAAQKVASLLNTYARNIENVRNQQIYDLKNVYVDTEFNSIVQNIAALNKQINEEIAHGNTPNELYDERDMLFDELSGLADIRINISPKWLSSSLKVEHVEVFIVDSTTGKQIDLIRDEAYNTLSLVQNADKTVSLNINSAFGNAGLSDVTQYMTGGTIGGALNIINGKGAEFGNSINGDNLFRGTLYYEGMLDALAVNFARVLNDINEYNPKNELPRSIKVSDPNNDYSSFPPTPGANPEYNPTDPFYDPKLDSSDTTGAYIDDSLYNETMAEHANERRDLFSTIDGSAIITASNIRISQGWLDDPMHLTITQPGDTSEGENIGRMIVAIERGFEFFRDGDTNTQPIFNGTLEEYFTGVNATLGLDVSLYTNYSKTSETVMTTLFTARESVSGVNLDEEGVNLMAYQKSYNAAVRFFTVLDEAVNTIINQMGLVGR
jgi:flagellar hook-associated protein 1 FlgK